ncbi:HigA family addiction module antitoxin [Halomonas sp. HNIBRBA4712]|uniref:HigA family addiction module antitoxin n=1 Tax=Halomonas sp. HNIBRBA4712 TaxID=3373087 RepID=UPI00374543F2
MTERKPTTVGEMLTLEFLEPLELSQSALARQMGTTPRLVNEICNDKRALTAETAIMLATVFGNTPDFWLNLQQKGDLWKALHSEKSMARIRKARPIADACDTATA